MKNSLVDLNSYLFEQMDRLSNPDLSGKELSEEIQRAKALADLGVRIVQTADLLLKARIAQDNFINNKSALPKVLED